MAQQNETKANFEQAECVRTVAKTDGGTRKVTTSKRDQLRKRLERKTGARLKDLEKALGWQAHTIRAAISGLRKAGHDVQREVGSDGAVYRIVASKADS
ncbi:DUF3489 domain-containing protein [Tabrizicola sp.]|uniref:DUF3489 domain-containing protein n=1 Tax=Tabrizicola sp. TaxID=2005166 RepID=UPI0035B48C98